MGERPCWAWEVRELETTRYVGIMEGFEFPDNPLGMFNLACYRPQPVAQDVMEICGPNNAIWVVLYKKTLHLQQFVDPAGNVIGGMAYDCLAVAGSDVPNLEMIGSFRRSVPLIKDSVPLIDEAVGTWVR